MPCTKTVKVNKIVNRLLSKLDSRNLILSLSKGVRDWDVPRVKQHRA